MRRSAFPITTILALAACASQSAGSLAQNVPQAAGGPTATPVSEADLRLRVGIFADDSMLGRAAGTIGEEKASAYLEREVRRLGLRPAGESGGYFQRLPFVKRTLDSAATVITINATTLRPWTDFAPIPQLGKLRDIDGVQLFYGGTVGDSTARLTADQLRGKLVVVSMPAGRQGLMLPNPGTPNSPYAGAAAIVLAVADSYYPTVLGFLRNGATGVAPADTIPARPIRLLIPQRMLPAIVGRQADQPSAPAAGATVRGSLVFRDERTPSRNVVAVVPGTDPALRGQYVAIGAHLDHVGTRPPLDHDSLRARNTLVERAERAKGSRLTDTERAAIRVNVDSLRRERPARADSVFNGADDDASGSMGLLELAEWFAAHPTRRSLLFVWHTAEEGGLIGARWFTDNPTVPIDSIVAQLNVDMIGRGQADDIANGGPGYLQLIGSRRLSTELGDLVETVNREGSHGFTFDYQYDATGHPEQYYCRSDHYMYARYGIPVVFFSTGDHVDYHQLTDEPQYIDYPGLARVTRFIGAVAARVANLDHRVVVDKPKPDPKGSCRQ